MCGRVLFVSVGESVGWDSELEFVDGVEVCAAC